MAVVLARLGDEDRESFGGPEWVRFDESELDDQPFSVLAQFETQMDTTLDFLLLVDKVARTERWKVAQVWLGRKLAGIDTPKWVDFDVKPRKIQFQEEAVEPAVEADDKGGDADPPSSAPSSAAKASKKASR